jgi:hypothetical protein
MERAPFRFFVVRKGETTENTMSTGTNTKPSLKRKVRLLVFLLHLYF